MKHLSLAVILSLVLVACSKDSPTLPEENASGENLSFKIDGTPVSVNAVWKTLPTNRWRLFWETTSGTYKNIEIDLYGNTPGTYSVQSSPAVAGQVGFQYYIQNGANYSGRSGGCHPCEFLERQNERNVRSLGKGRGGSDAHGHGGENPKRAQKVMGCREGWEPGVGVGWHHPFVFIDRARTCACRVQNRTSTEGQSLSGRL